MGIGFKFKDFFTTSKAEENYNKYRKIASKLEDEIRVIDKDIQNLADQLVDIQKIKTPISISVGKYVDVYNEKCNSVCSEISNNFIYYSEKQTLVKEKYDYVVERRDKWDQAVKRENENQQELTEEELMEV